MKDESGGEIKKNILDYKLLKTGNVLTKEINKIALSPNDDKRMQSIASIEAYAYRTSIDLLFEKDKIKRSNTPKQYKNV